MNKTARKNALKYAGMGFIGVAIIVIIVLLVIIFVNPTDEVVIPPFPGSPPTEDEEEEEEEEEEDPATGTDSCLEYNVKNGGKHLKTVTKIADEYACQTLCRNNSECNHFDFDTSRGYCYLRKNKGTTGGPLTGWISGPKICMVDEETDEEEEPVEDPEVDCIVSNFKYTGPHIKTISKVETPYQCQRLCQDDPNCTHFTLDTSRDLCMLKEGKGKGQALNGWISGTKECTDLDFEEEDEEDDFDFDDDEFEYEDEEEEEEEEEPEDDFDDDEFEYEDEEEEEEEEEPEDDDFPVDSCYVSDVKYSGPHITTITKIPDVVDCQNACKENADCTHFTLDTSRNYCYLKGGTGSAPQMEGWISGPKNC